MVKLAFDEKQRLRDVLINDVCHSGERLEADISESIYFEGHGYFREVRRCSALTSIAVLISEISLKIAYLILPVLMVFPSA